MPLNISFNFIVGFSVPQYGHLPIPVFTSLLQFLHGSMVYPFKNKKYTQIIF